MYRFVAKFKLRCGMNLIHLITAASMLDAMTRAMLYASRMIPHNGFDSVTVDKLPDEPHLPAVACEVPPRNPIPERTRVMAMQH